jgi:hypothetical protein
MDLAELVSYECSPVLEEYMMERWENDDIIGCLSLLSNMDYINFLMANMKPLLDNGYFEKVLLEALTMPKTNLHHIPLGVLRDMVFRIADKEKMRSAGDPIPGKGPFELYRGVSGNGPARRKYGLSWSSSFEVAK